MRVRAAVYLRARIVRRRRSKWAFQSWIDISTAFVQRTTRAVPSYPDVGIDLLPVDRGRELCCAHRGQWCGRRRTSASTAEWQSHGCGVQWLKGGCYGSGERAWMGGRRWFMDAWQLPYALVRRSFRRIVLHKQSIPPSHAQLFCLLQPTTSESFSYPPSYLSTFQTICQHGYGYRHNPEPAR
jgi:hypothetical protein